ncbi:MAG: hypothetical protein ACFFDF_10420 [Candidatus Odinarchaeota archaeon]
MSEQEFVPGQGKIEQELELEVKIRNILKENQGIAFTIGDLNNQLEEIIEDNDKLEFAKENLLMVLNVMKEDGKIDTIMSDNETHYIFKKPEKIVQEKPEETIREPTFKGQKTELESIKRYLNDNRTQVTKGVLLIALLLGLLTTLGGNGFEILTTLGFILIPVSIIIEMATASNQSKQNKKYERPIYGLVAIVFDLIGLIILTRFPIINLYYGSSLFLFAVLLFIIAVISGIGGLYAGKDSRPYTATVGLFFGMTFFISSLLPLIYYIVGVALVSFIH